MTKAVIAFLLTFLFLLVFFLYVPIQDLKERLLLLNPLNLTLAFCAYTVSQLTRAIRWKVLIGNLTLRDAFLINSVNILFNNVLPARTGELSWFYYANKVKVNVKVSLWSFFVGKLYDLIALLFFGLLGIYIAYKNLFLLVLLVTVAFVALLFGRLHFFIPKWKKLKELRAFVKERVSLILSAKLLFLSSLSIVFKFLGVYMLIGGELVKTFLGFSAGELSSVMPIHNFMGYGTYELSFSLPLKVFGASIKDALIDAFLVHNFLLISSFILGIPSLLLLHMAKH